MNARSALAALTVLALSASCRSASTPSLPPHAGPADASVAAAPAAPPPPAPPPPPELTTREQICRHPISAEGHGVAGATPFTREPGSCRGDDPFCDWVDDPPDPKDTCFVANQNISRAERASRSVRPAAKAPRTPWSRAASPKYFDRVDAHLHLDEAERARLDAQGFVVLDRLGYGSYAVAFHDVFQEQLPVYVGVDAVMNAVYQSSQMLLGETETTRLGPRLVKMIPRMRAELARSRAAYTAETVSDLDVYLTVADRLLRGDDAQGTLTGLDPVVTALVASAEGASGLETVELFGRERVVDFSQYAPRGHYTGGYESPIKVSADKSIGLDAYFRSMTWLSRLELNLVSRSCRSSAPGADLDARETPREARDALALADLARRSGSLGDIRAFEDVYGVFAGKREDVSVPDLLALAGSSGIGPRDADAPDRLRTAIGDRFQRTARTHFMPEGAKTLPAIATLFGSRIVPDIAPLTNLVHDRMPDRFTLGAPDVGYVLGQDRALTYLASDLKASPGLADALEKSRRELAAGAKSRKDVYGAWLRSIVALGEPAEGVVPSFMRTDAFADMRLSSALAGYAQLRHTFVLLAGQGYDAYGCEIPDGWVEPAVATYDALKDWVAAARVVAPARAAYFDRVTRVLDMLREISRTELSGAALSEPQRRWLAMVSEFTPVGGYADSGEPPKYTGWYFDLFPDREHGAEREIDAVADYFTLTNVDQVRYLGIEKAALGVFVVDVGGEPRAMVGPVVLPYETVTPIATRLDDEAARKSAVKSAPWLSYVAKAAPPPSLRASLTVCDHDARVVVQGDRDLGEVTVEVLDHHGDPLASAVTLPVGTSPVVFAFSLPAEIASARNGVEGFHVGVRDRAVSGSGKGRFDVVSGPGAYGFADPLFSTSSRMRGAIALGVFEPKE